MKMLKYCLLLLFIILSFRLIAQNEAKISEERRKFKTYPFSDPNPIPNPENSYYPYFRFDGFAKDAIEKEWSVVEMENDYIRVTIFPEIGGKIWGAVEKSTGHEFIYYNSVVKFRDIAMRGAWTSGGIELNFGIIGHAPTSATPVDYAINENEDGSVSCFLSATDLLTRTRWETEVKLEKDKAYFTTNTTWHNPTPLVQPYYQWMNAAYQVEGDLEFCFPGNNWIGHDGRAHSWPIDPEGREISYYRNNAFGGSKSNHVLGGISDHYAGYWHELEFGSGHYSPYGEKLGMKVFQWAHSRSGGIWEELLTDSDGQYVELQSGRLFNQAVPSSTKTPFKHFGFEPYATDVFREYWFPILKTKGVKKANPFGVINIEIDEDGKTIYFCPLQKIDDKISIYDGENLLQQIDLNLDVLETWSHKVETSVPLKIVVGNKLIVYSEKVEDNISNRPKEAPVDFDWESSYGKFLDGEHWLFQRRYELARSSFESCLQINPNYAPALNKLAKLNYRKADYQKGLEFASRSISINAYDVDANFIYGLINKEMGKYLDARDGFSVASLTPSYRTAAHIELSKLALLEGNLTEAEIYAKKGLGVSEKNIDANKLMAVISRRKGNTTDAEKHLFRIQSQMDLDHFVRFEKTLLQNAGMIDASFTNGIQSELPHEILMELAHWYADIGSFNESKQLLELAENPIALIHKAYLLHSMGDYAESQKVLQATFEMSANYNSPFRAEDKKVLVWAIEQSNSWIPPYYLALLRWNFGERDAAEKLFKQIGSRPDYVVYYLAKSQLLSGDKNYDAEKDLLKALDLDPDQWRVYARLLDHYLSMNKSSEALAIAKKAVDKFPDNNVLKYNYAKCLMADGQYSACKSALANTFILPSEGARYGRVTYRQACLMEAMEYYEAGKYSSAVKSIGSARLWPENLGVGKPFTVDERIENYVEAICMMKRGRKKSAMELFDQVVNYTLQVKPGYSSVDYLHLMSLRQLGREEEMEEFLASWLKLKSDDPIKKWCEAMLMQDADKASEISKTINTVDEGTPWDPAYADPEFEIVKIIGSLDQ